MACFIVPAAEAIVTTAVQKIVKRKEDNNGTEKTSRFSEKLSVLNGLLWGGSGAALVCSLSSTYGTAR